MDQSVLRAEQLAALYEPELLILSFIRADIFRTMTSHRGTASKPYFVIEDGSLELRNTPVSEPLRDLDRFPRVFGYSFLADLVMRRAAPQYWGEGPVRRVHGDPDAISCLLVQRLASLRGRVLIVAQSSRADEFDTERVDRVLACVRESGLDTLSLFPAFARLAADEPERYAGLFQNHLTPEGNALVAARIAEWIRRTGGLEPKREDRPLRGASDLEPSRSAR